METGMIDTGRIMGLDYGSKTVGVALTDAMCMTTQPYETITRDSETKLRRTLARLQEIVLEYKVQEIVLGFPVNMDGSVGERAQKTLEFKEKLEKRLQMSVALCDERLTSIAADEKLQDMQIPPRERKKYIDQIAAAIILEDYLNKQRER